MKISRGLFFFVANDCFLQAVFLRSSQCFLKEIENMYYVFLSTYRKTRESSGELEKVVETLACGLCSHSVSRSPKLPLMFLLNNISINLP